ncbi:hypothetical protein BABINDRAFT_161603 [Babjeviella inositovora NRRL Y-12698]|uniref:Nucleoporin Nup54 alpha-helical domain-containing protein n=1 Tax=Babjeviella inositovora NRRL Y-12698 TaxID=984486 RepID=A0A1E3QQM6_9ASCO|nr:uncharacterized protein BABINDRAFT_161603 [Babjeviella inositovora NRRL Y-12698]ODQ79938.1 hypothetical protein BABINDRAFT_161603 [Babjeviella inositovora NRRL Y-12698]
MFNQNSGTTGGFSFGSGNTAAAPASGGFSFGSSAAKPATTAANTSFSFGSTAPAAPTAGTNTSFSFGSTAPAAPTAAAPTAGVNNSFSFGSSAPTASPSTGFGAANTASNSAPSTGFSFGASAAPSSGISFGNKPAATTGGFSLGTPAAVASTTGGLFGGNTGTNATGSTGGLFANAGTSGSLFGSTPAATGTTGGFFGGTANTSLNTSTGMFGQNNTATQANAPTASNALQSSQPSFAWSSQAQPQTTQPQQPQQQLQISNPSNIYNPSIADQLMKLTSAWNANSDTCLLRTHFYNKVSENEALAYAQQRPQNETPESWEKAMQNRPDPKTTVPVRASGFEDVSKRVETQTQFVASSRMLLNQINEKQKQLAEKHELDTATRVAHAKQKHTQLARRILRLAAILAVIKSKGYPLSPEEEVLAKQFEELNKTLVNPTGLGRVNEIFARLAILKDRASNLSTQLDQKLGQDNDGAEAEKKNSESINKILGVLSKQQVGLQYLNDVLEKDKETLAKLEK